jgi:hypothetical protein
MKKLFVILMALALVWAFAAPASAVDWNFYGSARMATFWESTETGSGSTKTEDSELDWSWQNNSRIGARAKGETVSGRFELGLKTEGGGGGDLDVGTRRLEADWDFGAGTLSVAKGYTSFNQFVSGQVHASDAGLLGRGFMYAGRPGFIGLRFGGFGIQFIEPKEDDDFAPTGDTDRVLPKIEAGWGMAFDSWNFNLTGGWQYVCIKDVASVTGTGTNDIDVNSIGLGIDGRFNFGPAYVGAGLAYTQNGGNAGWTAGSGTFDNDDDVDDTNTTQAGVVVGFKMSDMVSFEGGFGYRNDDFDASNTDDTDQWELYVQSNIGLAPGVWLQPEFGYANVDAQGSSNDSSNWYLGAKWQMDF